MQALCTNRNMSIESHIEALLFFKAEPVRVKDLARMLSKSEDEIRHALNSLKESLVGRGIVLMLKDDAAMLATAPEASELIEEITKEELSKDLGKAGMETLSIILYRGPVTRAEVDYIRGVNSAFIIRNLMIRGLIEKLSNPKDQRSFLYRPTFELLSFLGVTHIEELPEYASMKQKIEEFYSEKQEIDSEESGAKKEPVHASQPEQQATDQQEEQQ